MRHYCAAFVIVFILLQGQLYAQESLTLLERKFAFHITNTSTEDILEKLVIDNDLFFSYNPDILPTEKYTFDFEAVTLGELLHKILPPDNFYVEVSDNQIIITKKEPEPLRISGQVTDADEQNPVPYASVTIGDESIGTMTNQDGRYDLVIPFRLRNSRINFRCLGYSEETIPLTDTTKTLNININPVSIKLREIEVRPVFPEQILKTFRQKIDENYEQEPQLMVTFYRETVTQDGIYLGVWEAVMEMLKTTYLSEVSDKVRFLKGRKREINPAHHNIKLKMQGGPWYINKLDVVKTMESFLSPEFEHLYEYKFDQPEMLNNRVTWVIRFNRKEDVDFPCFYGRLLFDSDTYALVGAEFSFDKKSLKINGETFIKREPTGIETRPEMVNYIVNYRLFNGKWQFYSAHSDVLFRIKQKKSFKTEYRSTTDVLVTQQYTFPRKARFGPEGVFRADDIFSDVIGPYDPDFWGNYNVIRPDEDLTNAIKNARLLPEDE